MFVAFNFSLQFLMFLLSNDFIKLVSECLNLILILEHIKQLNVLFSLLFLLLPLFIHCFLASLLIFLIFISVLTFLKYILPELTALTIIHTICFALSCPFLLQLTLLGYSFLIMLDLMEEVISVYLDMGVVLV